MDTRDEIYESGKQAGESLSELLQRFSDWLDNTPVMRWLVGFFRGL